jgi:hypothetical protein
MLMPDKNNLTIALCDCPAMKRRAIGVATIEAMGMLNWPADRLKILSIGTINDVKAPPRWHGKLPMASSRGGRCGFV